LPLLIIVCLFNSFIRFIAKFKSSIGVFLVFLINPCKIIIFPSYIVNKILEILSFKLVLTSHTPLYNFSTTGIPIGQPYWTVLISSPISLFSSLGKDFNHSLAGSLLVSVLKNLASKGFSLSISSISVPFLVHLSRKICPLKSTVGRGFKQILLDLDPPLFLWRGEIFLCLIAKVTLWHCQSVTLGHFEIKKVNIISYAIKENLALDIFNVKGSMILRGASLRYSDMFLE